VICWLPEDEADLMYRATIRPQQFGREPSLEIPAPLVKRFRQRASANWDDRTPSYA